MKKTLTLSAVAIMAAFSFGAIGADAYSFQNNLTVGSRGADVVELQSFLESKGYLVMPAGVAKGYFGSATQVGLARYQAASGISPAAGYFGPLTRANVTSASSVTTGGNSTVPGCTAGAVFSSTTGAKCDGSTASQGSTSVLHGSEASLEDFDARSGQDGDPQEGDEKSEVVAFRFNVEDGDIRLNRIDVNVDASQASENDPWKVFKKAYLMLDGKTIATISTDNKKNWSEDGDDTYRIRFSNLSSIVKEGDRADLTVAFDISSSVDGADDGDASYVAYIPDNGIRAIDASNIDQYIGDEDDTVSFDINEAGQDEELTIRESGDKVDASTLQVQSNKNSDWYTVLKGEISAKENDITLKSVPVTLSIDSDNYSDVIADAELVIDGKSYDQFTVSGTSTAVLTFKLKNEDVVIDAGDTADISLRLKFNKDTAYAQGTTVTASITSANVDAIDAEGADDLDASQLNGSLIGEAQTLRESGIIISSKSNSASVNLNTSSTSEDDEGVFTLRFDVQAFDQDMYIPLTSGQGTTSVGATYRIENSANQTISTGTSTSALSLVSGGKQTGNYVRLSEGQKATFELRVNFDPATTDFYRVQLASVNFNGSQAVPNASQTLSPESTYETSVVQVRS